MLIFKAMFFSFIFIQLLLVSKAKELGDIVLRQNERTILNTLNKDKHRTTIRLVSLSYHIGFSN